MFRNDPEERRESGVSSCAMPKRRCIPLSFAGAMSLLCLGALAGCGGSAAAISASGCLRSHGWKVDRVSSRFFVATRGGEELSYGSSGLPAYSVAPGWTGYGPPVKNGELHFACFPKFRGFEVRSSSSTVTLSSSPSR